MSNNVLWYFKFKLEISTFPKTVWIQKDPKSDRNAVTLMVGLAVDSYQHGSIQIESICRISGVDNMHRHKTYRKHIYDPQRNEFYPIGSHVWYICLHLGDLYGKCR